MNKAELSGVCRQMRRDIINMTANAGSGHPGGSCPRWSWWPAYSITICVSTPKIRIGRTVTVLYSARAMLPLLLRGSGGVGLYQPR